MLVAAMNPCPCGYFGDLKREYRCGPLQVQRYRQRISGPLLDRIDLHIEVPAVEYRDIASTKVEEGSAAIRERVGRAREQQRARFRSDKKINCNARMGPRQIRQHCQLSAESQETDSRGDDAVESKRSRLRPDPESVPHRSRSPVEQRYHQRTRQRSDPVPDLRSHALG